MPLNSEGWLANVTARSRSAGLDEPRHERRAALDVLRVQADRLVQGLEAVGQLPALMELGSQPDEPLHRTGRVSQLPRRLRGDQPGRQVRRVERPDPDVDLGRPAAVAPAHPALGDVDERGLGLDDQALDLEDLRGAQQRVLLVGLDLEDLLVDGGRPG